MAGRTLINASVNATERHNAADEVISISTYYLNGYGYMGIILFGCIASFVTSTIFATLRASKVGLPHIKS